MKRNSKRFLALFMAVSMSVTPTTVLHAEENSETDQIQNVEIKQDENIAQEDSETNEKSNSAENSKEEIGKNEQAEVKDTQEQPLPAPVILFPDFSYRSSLHLM